jgi:hypothetical protein
VPAGTACGTGQICDAAGTCSGCTQPSDCPGQDTVCRTRTCVAGACGATLAPAGTVADPQTAGDCKKKQCDGNGNIVDVADDTDLPVDGKQCTGDVCTAGTPSNPKLPAGTACNQNGGTKCDGNGVCAACAVAADCGADTPCQKRTCLLGVCGVSNVAPGTVVANPTVGDCRSNQCDGNGAVVTGAVDDTDLPADDGNQCTLEKCTAGTPSHPPAAAGTTCNQGGGSTCNAAGQCVSCTLDTQCPTGNACQVPKCNAGVCQLNAAAAGDLPAAQQTAGDCQKKQCDGAGNVVSVADGTDVPADDGNACTTEVCVAGAPQHTPAPLGTACNQGGGTRCDASGHCVACNTAADCPAGANECQTAACNSSACSIGFVAAGTPTVGGQTAGDCQKRQCDGTGHIVSVADNSDAPADDGNQCTSDVCVAGAPQHPNLPAGTACTQNGGTACDGAGTCAGAVTAPTVVLTSPADGAVAFASTKVAVTFSTAMNPSTLTAQTAFGPCTGSIQVSVNDFASCVPFAAAAPTMSGGNTVATLVPQPGLLVNRTYKVRVTTAAADASAVPMAAAYTSTTGFGASDPLSIVISQVYGGGGNSGAVYKNDFIELHNRGAQPVDVTGWSVQYASATGASWSVTPLTGTIQPGAYYLVQEQAGTGGTSALPTPEATGTLAMAAGAGKIALVSNSTALAVACPSGAPVVDLVGFGTTAACFEGTGPTPAPSATLSVQRATNGCSDLGQNATDFAAVTAAPRNGATPIVICPPTHNELGDGLEADWCATQSPLSLSVKSGTASGTIYGRLYEAGVTPAAGANASVLAQLGYGPASANPEYEAGWTWINATFNVQVGNDDEYQASFTAPAAGSYVYGYRISFDGGATFTYCDNAQSDGGAGSNASLAFDLQNLGTLTVTP